MTDYREELARQVRDAAGPHNDNDLPVITVVMRMEGEIQRLTDQLEQAQNGLRAVIELAARHQRTAGSGDEMFIEGLQSAAWKAQEFLPTKGSDPLRDPEKVARFLEASEQMIDEGQAETVTKFRALPEQGTKRGGPHDNLHEDLKRD